MPQKIQTLAHIRHEGKTQTYHPEPLVARLKELLADNNLSSRAAALGARLDHQALNRVFNGLRPNMIACILLADYFGLNPNEILALAAWPTLEVFDIRTENAEHLPPEVVEVALELAKIEHPGTRQKVAEAIRTLLNQYFDT